MNQSLNDRVSPVLKAGDRQTGTSQFQAWAKTAADTNLAKSAIITSGGTNLPEKLQRMKERVKRDRSANMMQVETGREDSLYGRKKMSSEVDNECQRLRESYGKHRKPQSKSDHSRSLLSKNFKEVPFDNDESPHSGFGRGRNGSTSYERNPKQHPSDKENQRKQSQTLTLKNQNDQSTNRYKRSQQRSNQALASYQQKYERLEKNFKKFTNNIMHAQQSEQIIGDLKFKTGFSIMSQILKKSEFKDRKRCFKIWRINSGVAHKQYQTQERTLKLAKCASKMHSRSLNYVKILSYQKWKKLSLCGGGDLASSRDRIVSMLSDMITDTQDFNQCIESDYFLSKILNEKLPTILGGVVASDFLLYAQNEEFRVFKAYSETGECMTFNIDSVSSILGRELSEDDQADHHYSLECPLHVVEHISSDKRYNEEVDMPVNPETISRINASQTNHFNKIRGLSMIALHLKYPQRVGVLRLYYSCEGAGVGSPTNLQIKQAQQLGSVLPQLLNRIFEVRSQINSLALQSMDQSQQIEQLEGFNKININLHRLQIGLGDNTLETHEAMLDYFKEEVEGFLQEHFQLHNLVLRQVIRVKEAKEEKLLSEDQRDLVRYNDHIQEDAETLEDFLDYKRDYFVHQVSVRPKVGQGALPQFGDLTFILQMVNKHNEKRAASMGQQRKYLESESKFQLAYYFKHLTPILNQGLKISGDLSSQIKSLEASVKLAEVRKQLSEHFQKFVNEQGLLKETNREQFQYMVHDSFQVALSMFEKSGGEQADLNLQFVLLNQFGFHRNAQTDRAIQMQFYSFLNPQQAQNLRYLCFEKLNRNMERYSHQQLSQFFNVYSEGEETSTVEVGLNPDILPSQMAIVDEFFEDESQTLVFLPLVNTETMQTMAVLVLSATNLTLLSEVQASLQGLLQDLMTKRSNFQILHEQHLNLLKKLDGEKMSQETRDLIDEYLIVPYLKKPTLKVLGDGIDTLSDKLIRSSEDQGQEVSQIAYLSPKTFIEDVRLFQSYSQYQMHSEDLIQARPDEIMMQSYQQQQQIVYEDEILDKVVIIYPIISQQAGFNSQIQQRSQMSASQANQGCALILRFVIERDEHVEHKLRDIHLQLISCIQPLISSSIQNEGANLSHTLALQKLTSIMDKYKFSNYREIIYFMRDLKAKNVFNFSRSRLFSQIARSRRFLELKNMSHEQELFDVDERHFEKNQVIQELLRGALMSMNKYAFRYKQVCFKRFVVGTKKPVYASLSKKKKKALTTLMNQYRQTNLRALFLKFAVNTKQYKFISHPKTKYVGSVLCIFRNFRVVRERLAFIKMKKNLNMYLRESMKSYMDNDKDLFIQLNQILLSSYQQQGGLEGGFAYSLSEVFNYLKNQLIQDKFVKDFMNIAHPDGFVGHLDEVVLTMKSQVYTSHGGQTMNVLSSSQNQKVRIFQAQFSQPVPGKPKALKVQYDTNLQLSQQDQLLNQITTSNIDNHFDQDLSCENDFDPNLSQQFQKYVISAKRDLIHQMLVKSNGIIFNFQNIQQSLSDIFLNQQSQHKDQSIGNRLAIVRRSKSALILPLFDVSQTQIIGSLELYKHHQLAFSDEIEQRYNHFSKRLADFFLLYGQLKAQSFQISQLKIQLQKNVKPTQSLSSLLKNVYVNAPGNHFPGASHVLPIIILNNIVRVSLDASGEQLFLQYNGENDSGELQLTQQKLAFFYQFKDNHIYNFEYEGTFIDELMDNGCILEMCQKNQMVPDEGFSSQILSGRGALDQYSRHQTDPPTDRSVQEGYSHRTNPGLGSGLGGSRMKNRTVQSSSEKVKSITNELFKHLIYYPIFDSQDETKIVAILEVGYKKKEINDEIISDDIQQYLDQFRGHLSQFKVRMGSFCRNLEHLIQRRAEKRVCQLLQTWKHWVTQAQYQEKFDQFTYQQMQNQEIQYGEYVQSLENMNNQLKQTNTEKERMEAEISQFLIEKKAKLKFLATSLVSTQNLFQRVQRQKCKEAFLKWQYNVSIRKIAATAFKRVLELNHRHSKARYKAAFYLLEVLYDHNANQTAFDNILHVANMQKNNEAGDRSYYVDDMSAVRASRSNRHQNSYLVNNSMVSPAAVEKRQQLLNGPYTPDGNLDEYLIQLRPEEVVKQVPDKQMRQAASRGRNLSRGPQKPTFNLTSTGLDQSATAASRYTPSHSQIVFRGTHRNPYNDPNLSQIEYTNNRKDFSPILTSKHDLRRIYEPREVSKSMNYFTAKDQHTILTNQNNNSVIRSDSIPSHKKARSVETQRRDGPKTRAGPMTTTKAELQKQLHLKQKQLVQMRKQLLQDTKTNNSKSGYPQRTDEQTRTRNFGRHSNDASSIRSSSVNLKVGPLQHQITQQIFTKPLATSFMGTELPKVSVHSNSVIQKPRTGNGLGKSERQKRSCDRLSKKHQKQKSMSSMGGKSFQNDPDTKYYSRINGRDVSPPVRLQKKKSSVAEQREMKEQKERQDSKARAAQNVAAALHLRYEEMKSN